MSTNSVSIYGGIPHHWSTAKLRDVCVRPDGVLTGPFGSQLHQRDYKDEGTPIITVEHLGENHIIHDDLPRVSDEDRHRLRRYTLKADDIVFSRVGSVDRRALVSKEEEGWLFSGRCIRVRPDPNQIDPSYLSWFFGLPNFVGHIRRIAVGATMPSLNTDLLSNVQIILPPRDEQKLISSILDAIKHKVILNHIMNLTLEEIGKALFQYWFIGFEFPNKKGTPYKSSGGELIDSELGKIPKDWRVLPLSKAFDINPTRNLSKRSVAPYVEMANMSTDYARIVNFRDRQFTSGSRFINGDTLVARITPCLENGKTAIVDFLENGSVGWGSTEFIVFRPKPPLPPEYGYFLSRIERFRTYAISNMTGSSGRQRVLTDCFYNFRIVIPNPNIGNLFGNLARTLISLMKHKDDESKILVNVRNILLPLLISGKIRVSGESR